MKKDQLIAKVNVIKILKIAIGSTIAMLIAEGIRLKFSAACGIITLLTIQDTKRETLMVALKRLLSFLMAMGIAIVVFLIMDFTVIAFGVFLLLFVGLSITFYLQEGISVNAVLMTHFLIEQSVGWDLILNECALMAIGVGIGIVLNMIIPRSLKKIKNDQRYIEENMKAILKGLADMLMGKNVAKDQLELLPKTENYVRESLDRAANHRNNYLFADISYFVRYMVMRKSQLKILRGILDNINKLTYVTPQAEKMAVFFNHIAFSFNEYNNGLKLLEEWKLLKAEYQNDKLPVTRPEFENRALLYQVLGSIEHFLQLKVDFVQSLSTTEIAHYWQENDTESRTV